MSRMRQIPVIDASQRERMLQQNQPPSMKTVNTPYNVLPKQSCCRPHMRKPPAPKFRLSDTPSLIRSGCSSVRQLCNNVQNITVDLNNLMGSVESMVPLLNTYLTMLQSRNAIPEQEPEPPIEVPQAAPAAISGSMPRPEDIQTLLENPLVRNLLTGFMQSGAFPNISAMKENTPHQS